jgi:hypothetical protein
MIKDIFGASKTPFSSYTPHSAGPLRPRICKASSQDENRNNCGSPEAIIGCRTIRHTPHTDRFFGTARVESHAGIGAHQNRSLEFEYITHPKQRKPKLHGTKGSGTGCAFALPLKFKRTNIGLCKFGSRCTCGQPATPTAGAKYILI